MAKKRGPKADPRQAEFDQLSRENAKLRRKHEVAELIIDAQEEASSLLETRITLALVLVAACQAWPMGHVGFASPEAGRCVRC